MTRRADPRELRGHYPLSGDFRPGSVVLNAVPVTVLIPVPSVARFRVRFLSTVNGTLAGRFVRPDDDVEYQANQPADVTITGGVETKLDVELHFGEGYLKLTFTPSGNGNITYADCSQV